MARIKVLQPVGGLDFSWAPGDVVDVSDEQAEAWADGHRAIRVDDQEHDAAPAAVQHQPLVVGEDGEPLEVLAATIEEIPPPDGADDGPPWVRWSVTVRLPAPAPADGPDGAREHDGDVFDPAEHSAKDVLAYLEGVGGVEAERVLQAEETSPTPRKGVLGQRAAILERARANDQAVAEKTAQASRGGGRGDIVETR